MCHVTYRFWHDGPVFRFYASRLAYYWLAAKQVLILLKLLVLLKVLVSGYWFTSDFGFLNCSVVLLSFLDSFHSRVALRGRMME